LARLLTEDDLDRGRTPDMTSATALFTVLPSLPSVSEIHPIAPETSSVLHAIELLADQLGPIVDPMPSLARVDCNNCDDDCVVAYDRCIQWFIGRSTAPTQHAREDIARYIEFR
jgi:hypothetical protein